MKNLSMMLVILLMSIGNSYAQEWIPFQGYRQTTVVQNYPSNPTPQPVVIYQWVPVVVNQNTIVEQHCLFRKIQTVTVQPVVQWVYQPVLIYR